MPIFFSLNDGRLDIPSRGNIRSIEEGTSIYGMSFLTTPCDTAYCNNLNFIVTADVGDHYSLFDWFHQDNYKKAEETLRKWSLVKGNSRVC